MASLLIRNARLYDAAGTDSPCGVLVKDGTIERIGDLSRSAGADRVLDAGGRILAPGLIDVHIQGAGGADVLDAAPEALEAISKTCARFGVTGLLATTVYNGLTGNDRVHAGTGEPAPDGGGRLRGPRSGRRPAPRHSPRKPFHRAGETGHDPAGLYHLPLAGHTGRNLMMVIAPELPGNIEIIRALTDRGTVACLGHSAAAYDDARRGFQAGISHITHLFNAMPSLHHRAPGPLGAIFEADNVTCQVITDGVHIHPSVVRLAYAALGPDRFVTITDGMQALGLPDGQVHLQRRRVRSERRSGPIRRRHPHRHRPGPQSHACPSRGIHGLFPNRGGEHGHAKPRRGFRPPGHQRRDRDRQRRRPRPAQ